MDADFKVGDWIIRPERLRMHLPGRTVHVTPKAMAVLVCLSDAKGHVVARNDILDKVWPGAVVTDDVLTQCIVELRKAFGDSAHDPRYIETIPRKGFRLVAPVTDIVEDTASESKWPEGRRLGAVIFVVAVMLAAGTWLMLNTWHNADFGLSHADKTVAVLPFVDNSASGDQGYLANGITEEIITRLSSIEDLLVIGRASKGLRRDDSKDIATVASELDVRFLLEGSVARSENEIHVTARLVDTESTYTLWTGTYNRALDDIFSVQDEIAESVARALSLKLNVGLLKDAGTRNVEAFEAYWLGIEAFYDGHTDPWVNKEGHRQAVGHFRRATQLDPGWAHAWAYLAQTYGWGGAHYLEGQPWAELALEALQRADDLAPDEMFVAHVHAQLHTSLGNWKQAEEGIRRLESLYEKRPGIDEKLASALAVWPTDFAYWTVRLDINIKTGKAGESVDAAEVLRARYAKNGVAALYLEHVYAMLGQSDKAMEILEEFEWISEALIVALGTGDAELIQRWLSIAAEREARRSTMRGINQMMAQLIDDRDAALAWLRDAYERESEYDWWIAIWAGYHDDPELALDVLRRSRNPWGTWLPVMEGVRRSPGFVELVHDIGLVDYWEEYGWGDFCERSANGNIVCE